MRFRTIIEIFKERMADVEPVHLFLLIPIVLLIISFAMWRWKSGFFMALGFILTGLLLTKSNVVNGLALMARFLFVIVLVFYAFFSGKNRISFSKTAGVLALLPLVMLFDTPRAINLPSALGQSILFLSFFIGLILGGQRILGDARSRANFVKVVALFTIIMTCIQIPFWSSADTLFEGTFETTVGFMIIGMTGVIVLSWFAMNQRIWSIPFIFYTFFAFLTFIFLLVTGGRTALGGTLLGVLMLLVRKLRRNLVIALAGLIILGPIVLKAVLSFPGFEIVRAKLFSTGTTGRAELYALAWDEIKVKPWVGWGTGSAYIKSAVAKGMSYHQAWLHFAVNHGIPFSLVMMLTFLWLPFRGLYLMRKCPTEEMKNMANLSAALLSAYVFASFLSSDITSTTGILPAYSAIALQEGVRAEHREMEFYGLAEYDEEGLWGEGLGEMV